MLFWKYSILHNVNYSTNSSLNYLNSNTYVRDFGLKFNHPVIDSLKIRVRLSRVKILDNRLIADYIKYYPSIQQMDEDKALDYGEINRAQPMVRIINGITYRFYIKAFITAKKEAQEYVVFQISAKMAKADYWRGITLSNLQNIVDDINALGILHIKRSVLLDGLVSDIDICINSIIQEKPLKVAFGLISTFALPSKKPLIHSIARDNKKGKNLGLDFNKREKATPSVPYCKIYHKGYELLSKSIDFYKAYLEPMPSALINNLVRYEFTIKAHKHKEYLTKKGFKADIKTLHDLLSSKKADLKAIALSGLPHYTEPKTQPKHSKLNPTDSVLEYFIGGLIEAGWDRDKILGFRHLIADPSSASRAKTKVAKLTDNFTIHNTAHSRKLQQNDEAGQFLKSLNIPL